MNQLLIHFFPLFTLFLFCIAGVFFYRYINSIRKIEKYLASERPVEWEAMGKPDVFSRKYSEENTKFKNFFDSSNPSDEQVTIMWERTKQIKQTLKILIWSSFSMYFVTIVAVRILSNNIVGS